MPDVRLTVNGRAYGGWTAMSITRGIETIAGSFDLEVSERWDGQSDPWPILEEDACVVTIDGQPVVTGYIDRRHQAFDAQSHSLRVSGRDRAGALVDNSAVLDKWEFLKVPVLDLCTKVAAPFGVTVTLQDGLADRAIGLKAGKAGGRPSSVGAAGTASSMRLTTPIAKLTIDPGDSPFAVIDRAARLVGALAVSDGAGGVVLTRAGGTTTSTALVEGTNILAGEMDYDGTNRYRRYVVRGQSTGSDVFYGRAAAAVSGQATDAGVRRADRVLLIRPNAAVSGELARQRAAWEATVRAARAIRAQITVQGWTQDNGELWPINALVSVTSPRLGIDGSMLITEATYQLSESGTTTTLSLVRPDAFIPEPTIVKPTKGKGGGDALFKTDVMSIDLVNRLLEPLRRRLDNLVARAVVSLVDDALKLQAVQLQVLEDETRDGCERFQQYGLTSVPKAGAEAVVIFVGGQRDHPLVLAVDDRRYRKRELQAGEVALYTDEGAYFLLKRGQVHESNAPIDLVGAAVLKMDGVQVVGPQGTSVTAPTGGGTVDAQARTAINALINRLQAHGLIA